MILAGVDEAGLGPKIGPLITASAALSAPEGWMPGTPWQALSAAVTDKPRRGEGRLVVADSKIAYARGGAACLERTIAAVVANLGEACHAGALLRERTGLPRAETSGVGCPWYEEAAWNFPAHLDAAELEGMAMDLSGALTANGAKIVHFEAAVADAGDLNARFARGMNKHEALLEQTGSHVRELVDRFSRENMLIVVDKQGGRNDYRPFLSGLFPGAWFDTLSCGAEESRYRLRHGEGETVIVFAPKADRYSFATALASMHAKYLRERCMANLNRWFCQRAGNTLKSTAGYPVDAERWLAEVGPLIGELGLKSELLVRER